MPDRYDAHTRLEALVEANDQLYWGKNADELEKSARNLLSNGLNGSLAETLFNKACDIRALKQPLIRLV